MLSSALLFLWRSGDRAVRCVRALAVAADQGRSIEGIDAASRSRLSAIRALPSVLPERCVCRPDGGGGADDGDSGLSARPRRFFVVRDVEKGE